MNSPIYLKVRDMHVREMGGCRRVLDSGAGTGNVTIELLKAGAEVWAIDPSKRGMEHLRRKCREYGDRLHTYVESAEKLGFPDGFFDGITSMWVFHFLEEPEGYLGEQCRVLEKGGKFIITWRKSAKGISRIADSYERSLKRAGKFDKAREDFKIFKQGLLRGVSSGVRNPYSPGEIIKYPIINDGVCTRACIIILHGVHLANSALKSGV